MGLLGGSLQRDEYGQPIGWDNYEEPSMAPGLLSALYDAWEQQNTLQKASVFPVIGDAAGVAGDIQMMYENPEERTWLNALLTAAGAFPVVPSGLMGVTKLTGQAKKAADEVPALAAHKQYITEEEVPAFAHSQGTGSARRFAETQRQYPSANEMGVIARSGGAKAGWYPESKLGAQIVLQDDAPRFIGLLSAMSPQTSVESNLKNALNTWTNWVEAGRPTNSDDIMRILGQSVEGDKGVDSVLDAWVNNSMRALQSSDPYNMQLSGPKVESFRRNLLGDYGEVTNDAWMANYGLIDQNLFGGGNRVGMVDDIGKVGIKKPSYIAANATTRRAAEGQGIDPSEVQETIWSWAKTLYENAGAAGMTPSEYLSRGLLTDEAIGATPAFGDLFRQSPYSDILVRGGYGDRLGLLGGAEKKILTDPYTRVGADPENLAGTASGRHLQRAAGRLDKLQSRRAAQKAVTDAQTNLKKARMARNPLRKNINAAERQLRMAQTRLRAEMKRSPNVGMTPKERRGYGIAD